MVIESDKTSNTYGDYALRHSEAAVPIKDNNYGEK